MPRPLAYARTAVQASRVAPLAATRSGADFVAIGFDVVALSIEEDREQDDLRGRVRQAWIAMPLPYRSGGRC